MRSLFKLANINVFQTRSKCDHFNSSANFFGNFNILRFWQKGHLFLLLLVFLYIYSFLRIFRLSMLAKNLSIFITYYDTELKYWKGHYGSEYALQERYLSICFYLINYLWEYYYVLWITWLERKRFEYENLG